MKPEDLTNAVWRKSSRSNGQGECVELAYLADSLVAARDSKDKNGPVLIFSRDEFRSFVHRITDAHRAQA